MEEKHIAAPYYLLTISLNRLPEYILDSPKDALLLFGLLAWGGRRRSRLGDGRVRLGRAVLTGRVTASRGCGPFATGGRRRRRCRDLRGCGFPSGHMRHAAA